MQTSLRIFLSPFPTGSSSLAISHSGISNNVLITLSSRNGKRACHGHMGTHQPLKAYSQSWTKKSMTKITSLPWSEMHLSSLPMFLFQILCTSSLISSSSETHLNRGTKNEFNLFLQYLQKYLKRQSHYLAMQCTKSMHTYPPTLYLVRCLP